MSTCPLVLILLGPPGSGKGTQAKLIEHRLQLVHISTGDLLRDHIKQKTSLGNEAQGFISAGKLVPDPLILGMLFDRVRAPDCARGYILDGFPRTVPQAEALNAFLGTACPPRVVNLTLSDTLILERLSGRLTCTCCGASYHVKFSPPRESGICDQCKKRLIQRGDDTEEVILKRLEVYKAQTAPLIAFYGQHQELHSINCNENKEIVFEKLISFLKKWID